MEELSWEFPARTQQIRKSSRRTAWPGVALGQLTDMRSDRFAMSSFAHWSHPRLTRLCHAGYLATMDKSGACPDGPISKSHAAPAGVRSTRGALPVFLPVGFPESPPEPGVPVVATQAEVA
jgi:hypothetical protein